jgi:hypothetical protein
LGTTVYDAEAHSGAHSEAHSGAHSEAHSGAEVSG